MVIKETEKMNMKKHTIFFLCFWTGILSLRAQFTITAIQPPSNFVYEDLWHLNVTGPATSNYDDFIISLRIYDENGVLDVKSNSSAFAFSYLPLYVNKTNLGPLPQFTTLYYNSTQLENIIQAGGYFPPGVYNIQFILLGRPTDGEYSELADYTYQQFVEALWPPTLLTPYDEDTIDTPYPLLTWTPAYFASGGQQILYTLNMVELNVHGTYIQSVIFYGKRVAGYGAALSFFRQSARNRQTLRLDRGGQYQRPTGGIQPVLELRVLGRSAGRYHHRDGADLFSPQKDRRK
jgi:hypothetical protein